MFFGFMGRPAGAEGGGNTEQQRGHAWTGSGEQKVSVPKGHASPAEPCAAQPRGAPPLADTDPAGRVS